MSKRSDRIAHSAWRKEQGAQRIAQSAKRPDAVRRAPCALRVALCAMLSALCAAPAFAQPYHQYGEGTSRGINYDPATSGLVATTPQAAIDEVKAAAITAHSGLSGLDQPDHDAINCRWSTGTTDPTAGTVASACHFYTNTTPTPDVIWYGTAIGGNFIRWDDIAKSIFQVCFDADCETATAPTGLKFQSTGATIAGSVSQAAGVITADISAAYFLPFGMDDQAVADTDYLQKANVESLSGSATQANSKQIIPFTGNITEIYCKSETAPGGTETHTYTVATVATPQGSLADSTMVFTNTGTTLEGNSTTNPVAVTKGSFAGIKKVDSATAAASNYTVCFLKLEG